MKKILRVFVKNLLCSFLAVVFVFVLTHQAMAITRDVCKSGCSYSTIQAGIDAAGPGDVVLVDDGVYTENISFLGKNITVKSGNGAAATIIDGNGGTVVNFSSKIWKRRSRNDY